MLVLEEADPLEESQEPECGLRGTLPSPAHLFKPRRAEDPPDNSVGLVSGDPCSGQNPTKPPKHPFSEAGRGGNYASSLSPGLIHRVSTRSARPSSRVPY